jgi:hypothetical protein
VSRRRAFTLRRQGRWRCHRALVTPRPSAAVYGSHGLSRCGSGSHPHEAARGRSCPLWRRAVRRGAVRWRRRSRESLRDTRGRFPARRYRRGASFGRRRLGEKIGDTAARFFFLQPLFHLAMALVGNLVYVGRVKLSKIKTDDVTPFYFH